MMHRQISVDWYVLMCILFCFIFELTQIVTERDYDDEDDSSKGEGSSKKEDINIPDSTLDSEVQVGLTPASNTHFTSTLSRHYVN